LLTFCFVLSSKVIVFVTVTTSATQQQETQDKSTSLYESGVVEQTSADTKQQSISTDFKTNDVKQWVESSYPQRGPPYRPRTPPCPPPDIVSSNVVKPLLSPASSSSLSGARIEGKNVYLGAGEDAEVLSLDKDNELLSGEIEELRAKWLKEKEELEAIKDTLMDMLHLSSDQLKEIFKEKKKQKLLLMIK